MSFNSFNQDQTSSRPPFGHSTSGHAHSTSFNVAGMASSSGGHTHASGWGAASTGVGDAFAPGRSQYQPGYMMSMSQANDPAQDYQRHDQIPIVPTKAKMNTAGRGAAADFGMESMFQSSSTQRQPLTDEDAPPTTSVNDFMNSMNTYPSDSGGLYKSSTPSRFPKLTPAAPKTPTADAAVYVVVFGYPPDKYTATANYFASLGACTSPDPSTEISNCFRIGFPSALEAMRAVRKSGEVLGGSWMVGVKWADAAQAEALLGQSVRGGATFPMSPTRGEADEMAVDQPPPPESRALVTQTLTVGTPVKLAPSASAFRRPGTPARAPVTHAPLAPAANGGASPTKGVIGQVSDLIFGW